MYIDALLRVSNAQAVTVDAVSERSIDVGAAGNQIGTGEEVGFGVQVGIAAAGAYNLNVVDDDNEALGSPRIIASYAKTQAELAVGSLHFCPVPPGFPTQRYLGMAYDGDASSVTVTAWLTTRSLFSILAKSYPKNYVV